jgi:hypothetical protein
MKKHHIILSLFFITFTALGQRLRILKDKADVTNTVMIIPIVPNQHIETTFSIFNSSNNTISYQVNRTILNPPMNDSCASLYLCAGQFCYLPNASITWTPKSAPTVIPSQGTIPDGSGKFGLITHYVVCPKVCNDLYVYYRVYDTSANTIDTAFVEIRYTCTSGVENDSNPQAFVSDPYPNPASNSFSFSYDLAGFSIGEITINDITGKEIQRTKLLNKRGSMTLPISELPSGIYFYSLRANNSKICTKKLIIQ